MSKQRNSNIELLRVVLMTLIVVWHYIMHGLDMKTPAMYQDEQWNNSLAIFSASFMSFPVDCFIFISGYFGLTITKMKIIRFLLMIITYSLITLFMGFLIGTEIGWYNFIQALFPISSNRWWFFTAYFYLLLLSPFLNSGVEKLEKSTYQKLLVLYFISFFGLIQWGLGSRFVDLHLFIFIYLLGRYIKKYPVAILYFHPIYVCGICLFLILTLTFLSVWTKTGFLLYRIWYYHNPLVLALAISVFFVFYKSKEWKDKVYKYISGGVLSTYLLTDSWNTQEWYNDIVVNNFSWELWPLIAIITIVFCSMIELVRSSISEKILNKLWKR